MHGGQTSPVSKRYMGRYKENIRYKSVRENGIMIHDVTITSIKVCLQCKEIAGSCNSHVQGHRLAPTMIFA